MEQTHPQKQNFRAKEAAEYLGIARSTIWLYAKQGRLNPIRLSPRITVFKREDLDNLVQNGAA